MDRSLNEAAADKIRKYRADYNNNPPSSVAFMPTIPSTSERLHSEFVLLLFLQAHRETESFFASSGVQLAQSTSDQFHYKHTVFSSHLRSKVVNILAKVTPLWITLNIDGTPVVSRSHSPMTLTNLVFINLVYVFRCYSSPHHPVYVRLVDPSGLAFSLTSHRHSSINLLFSFRFIDS